MQCYKCITYRIFYLVNLCTLGELIYIIHDKTYIEWVNECCLKDCFLLITLYALILPTAKCLKVQSDKKFNYLEKVL